MSDLEEKNDLIQELLRRSGLEFEEGMSREDREALDRERHTVVLRVGWNKMSVRNLKQLLESKEKDESVSITHEGTGEVHPIFAFLKNLMKNNLFYYCISPDHEIKTHVNNYLEPVRKDIDPETYTPSILVVVTSCWERVNKLEQEFRFLYPKDEEWKLTTDGNIEFSSALCPVFWTFWERDKNTFSADDGHPWVKRQLDVLLELLKMSESYNPYHAPSLESISKLPPTILEIREKVGDI